MNCARKKIIFDASSLIPVCLHPNREPAAIFKYALLNHELFGSTETLKELIEVLSRAKFETWQPLAQRLEWIRLYNSAITFIEITHTVNDCRDIKDNKFLDLALSAGADIIISSDVHLWELHPYRGVAIMKLQEFKTMFM